MSAGRTRRYQDPVPLSRRQFLARCGALGAAALVVQVPGISSADAVAAEGVDEASAALRTLTVDTLSGLVAFVVPGPDRYSQAQGLTDSRPGGVDARAPEAVAEMLDSFVALPDSFLQAMAAAFATAVSSTPIAAGSTGEQDAAAADRALQSLTGNDEAAPLSLLAALMLNFVATSVDPGSVSGPFASAPFANLSYAEKAEVFRRLEEDNAEVVELLDGEAPEPIRGSLSGEIRLVAGVLPAVAALGAYSEYGVFDARLGVARARPVGWDLSRYALGRTAPADGWNELQGYYEGRRQALRTRRGRRRGRGGGGHA